jgi:hypothetical protein
MKRILTALTAVAALAVGGSTYAAQQSGTAQAPAKKPAAEATHVMSGTVARFDSVTNMLTLSTKKGEESFKLAPKATIHEGQKAIAAADLNKLTGREVTVHYVESGGQRTAESVMIGAKPAGTTGTAKEKPKY